MLSRLKHAKLDRNEIAGSLGDMGTFLPLLVALSIQNGMDFGASLFFAGLFNIVTGLAFSIPMAVQPMKAIAAIALTKGLTVPEILAAGITVSAVILALGVTGLIGWVSRIVPKSVVRGLQLALGLSLLMKGLQMVAGTRIAIGPDSYLTGALSALMVMALFLSRRVPVALVLFVAGLILAVGKEPGVLASLRIVPWVPRWTPPEWGDFASAFSKAALPQIPLTALNSVVAVCALSSDLFPERPAPPRKVAVSVGCMNLVAAWFGGMPMCHGAGGLAGQYRFGARTNGSILFLGAAKIAVALLFGASLLALCRSFPASILGVMLAVSGTELALVTRDQTERASALTMFLTAGACLSLDNVGIGFLIGLALALCLALGRRLTTGTS
ncbi:MAG: sulfate transporter [Candidatus Eisenbacteria bacterium]|nr:sulfate transporter [Candidatus Eisenbacteria bacterium]